MPLVSLQQSPEHNLFTDGGRELFDAAGQGRIDVFFFSGAEIDGAGNINLVAIGDYARPSVRFPGSYGSAFLYFTVPRIILFRTEHSRRTLVEKVSFVSAPGTSPPGVWRRGGPVALVTPLCHFAFDAAKRRFRLESVHPGHAIEEVRDNTGFAFDVPDQRGDHADAGCGARSPSCAAMSRASLRGSIRNSPPRCSGSGRVTRHER